MSRSEFFGILGLVASVIGIPLTYYLTRRSRERPRLRYAIDSDVLVDPSDGLLNEGLVMTFRDVTISRVSRTYVALWNHRGDTVSRTDIVETDPLRIQLNPSDLPLQARVVSTSRRQVSFQADIDADTVKLTFDFLDAGDGAIVEVLHQGPGRPGVDGTIRGAHMELASDTLSMTPRDWRWMRAGTRRSRLLARLRRGVSPRTAVPLVLLVAVPLSAAIAIGWSEYRRGHPDLVPASKFQLDTLRGQKRFADAVREHGIQSGEAWWVLAIVAGQLLFSVLYVAWRLVGRQVIPRSIVQEDPTAAVKAAASGEESVPAALPSGPQP